MRHPCGKVIYCSQCWRMFIADEFDSRNPPKTNCSGCKLVMEDLTPKPYKAAPPPPKPPPPPPPPPPEDPGPSLFG